MAKVMITGANGNIGVVLTEHLKKNHDLTLVDVDFSNLSDSLLEGTTYLNLDLVKRVSTRSTNLGNITRVNDISRRVTSGVISIEEAY
uniref:threonine/serine exporter family protein n=1 Tax=Jeotgalibaca porci TaxID=1868793 RepID=UPI0035A11381